MTPSKRQAQAVAIYLVVALLAGLAGAWTMHFVIDVAHQAAIEADAVTLSRGLDPGEHD
jgi:hypothetical protein